MGRENYYFVGVLLVLLVFAACQATTPPLNIPTGQSEDPSFSPAQGDYQGSVDVSISAGNNDETRIFYDVDGSIMTTLDQWMTEIETLSETITSSVECSEIFHHFNSSVSNETFGNNSYSWQFHIGGAVANGWITETQVNNCQYLLSTIGPESTVTIQDFLFTVGPTYAGDCAAVYAVIQDIVDEDLNAWQEEFGNLDPQTTDVCLGLFDELNQTIQGDLLDAEYTGPFTITESTTVTAVSYREGTWPSAMTSATYTITGSGPINFEPDVNAGPDLAGNINEDVTLEGKVTDDGLPNPPGEVVIEWTKKSGPGTVTIRNPDRESTVATFSTAGIYVLTLSGFDGEFTSRDDVQVTINDIGNINNPPIVTITEPDPQTDPSFKSGEQVSISATFEDTDGTIASYSILVDGAEPPAGSCVAGPAIPLSCSVVWTAQGVGSHVIRAEAVDNQGAIGFDELSINVEGNTPPIVEITSPQNGDVFIVGDTVDVNVNATDNETSVAKVILYGNDVKVGEDSSYPYSWTVTSAPRGEYVLKATALDTQGALGSSEEISVSVQDSGVLSLVAIPAWLIEEETETTVSCSISGTANLETLYLFLDGVQVDSGNTPTHTDYLSPGSYEYACSTDSNYNGPGANTITKTLVVTPAGDTITIVYDEKYFDEITDFGALTTQQLMSIEGVVFDRTSFGRIQFIDNVSINRSIDLRGNILIENNSIFINSTALPEFDRRATITFRWVTFNNPILYKDGSICSSSECTLVSAEPNIPVPLYTYDVNGFSEYEIKEAYCGDNTCNGGETCDSCDADCGALPQCDDGGSGGGGGGSSSGGGGGFRCTPDWECTSYGLCQPEGKQYRTCTDLNDCGTTTDKPLEESSCVYFSLGSGDNENNEQPQNSPEEQNPIQNIPEPQDNENAAGGFNWLSYWWVIIVIALLVGLALFFVYKRRGESENLHNPGVSERSIQQCREYIDRMRMLGKKDPEIKTRMKANGWTEDKLDYVFKVLKK